MTTLVEHIADWVADLEYEDLPPAVATKARHVLLDTLGCALGALDAKPVRLARRVAREQGGNPQATPVGSSWKTSSEQAAFIDGLALRYLDLNDYTAAGSHPSINVAPALAAAEARGLGGKELLLGLTLGYELQLRLREATERGTQKGWDHSTGVHYSSAAVAAKLFGLPPPGIAHALAIAGAHASTLAEVRKGRLSMWKAAAEAMAARNGTFAAILARAGFTGPLTILEGGSGYGAVVTGALDAEVLRRKPQDYAILKSCVKAWPCVFVAQAPIAAALAIRSREKIDPAEIERIAVYLGKFAYEQQKSFLPAGLATRETADHSVPYCVARALLDGEVRVDHFDEKGFTDPRALALFDRVSLELAPELPDRMGTRVEVSLRNGRRFAEAVPCPPGHTDNPMSEADLLKKFFGLAEAVLGKERAEKAADAVLHVEKLSNLSGLLENLRSAADENG